MTDRRSRKVSLNRRDANADRTHNEDTRSITLSDRFAQFAETRREVNARRQTTDRFANVMTQRTGRGGAVRGGRGGQRGNSRPVNGAYAPRRGGNAPRGGGRIARGGRGGGRGGRGGRGGGRGGRKPQSKEDLDKELDKYMLRDEQTAKAYLDDDLVQYMKQAEKSGNEQEAQQNESVDADSEDKKSDEDVGQE